MKEIFKTKLNKKEQTILSLTIALWGIVLIGSGLILSTANRTIVKTNYKVSLNQKQVAQQRTNEIKLKDLEIEENTTLSVFVSDYLEDASNIDEKTLSLLKLDTSNVKTTEAGTYTYTISYKKKKYNGTIKVKEKEQTETKVITPNSTPNITLQLKDLKQEVGTSLSSDPQDYTNTSLTEEMKKSITLDISKVSNNIAGEYQYSIIYNNTTYTGKITFYNPQPVIDSNNSNTQTDKTETTNTQ